MIAEKQEEMQEDMLEERIHAPLKLQGEDQTHLNMRSLWMLFQFLKVLVFSGDFQEISRGFQEISKSFKRFQGVCEEISSLYSSCFSNVPEIVF